MSSSILQRRRRRLAVAVVTAAAALALVAVAAPLAAAKSHRSQSGFTASETIKRTYVDNGVSKLVDKRHFTVNVSQTQDLRDRQEISVSWRGAHPTGGIVGDENSEQASQQEYPVVLMMCRGVASKKAPVAKRISPQTCWTATPQERSQSDHTFAFPPYRVDQYATAADRGPSVGLPAKLPAECVHDGATSGVQRWVPFVSATGKRFGYGPLGCAGLPPEASVNDASQPSNTTFAPTHPDGSGSTNFVINTSGTNASLGCSTAVPCSLVAVPIMGISCDPAAFGLPSEDQPATAAQEQQAAQECETKGNYAPGQVSSGTGSVALAVSGELWWSASNWRNRIAVPLSFSAPDNVCSLVNNQAPEDIYGSPLLTQAAEQWAPYFCTDSHLFNFQHVITSEPEAKNLLQQGSIGAAFQASPPQTAFTNPVVQAPTALTGFAVVYAMDTAKGTKYVHLKLDARLLAKLLTESYPAASTVQQDYATLRHNPLDLAADPEFQALNPGLPAIVQNSEPASMILTLSSDSDVTWALTSYINSDPEARAWLNGKPDPWGMKVNPAYRNIKLPVTAFPLLDTFIPTAYYANNPCVSSAPVPYLPLVAAPVESQAVITLDMQFDLPNSQVNCIGAGSPGQHLGALGRETPGQRFLLGVTSLGDAKRYDLTQAALETQGGSTGSAKFTSAKGRTFVGPTTAGLLAGAHALAWNKAAKSWALPYAALRHSTVGKSAYPGTMLISTDVPAKGLTTTSAHDYSEFLTFAAGRGQTPGFGNGDLPPGFLPMTAANGLGDEVAYTRSAAVAVQHRSGEIPNSLGKLPNTSPTKSPSPTSSPTTPSTSGSTAPTSSSSGSNPGSGSSPVPSPAPSSSAPPTPTPSASPNAVSLGKTPLLAAEGLPAKALPAAGILAVLAALGLVVVWLVGRRGLP